MTVCHKCIQRCSRPIRKRVWFRVKNFPQIYLPKTVHQKICIKNKPCSQINQWFPRFAPRCIQYLTASLVLQNHFITIRYTGPIVCFRIAQPIALRAPDFSRCWTYDQPHVEWNQNNSTRSNQIIKRPSIWFRFRRSPSAHNASLKRIDRSVRSVAIHYLR